MFQLKASAAESLSMFNFINVCIVSYVVELHSEVAFSGIYTSESLRDLKKLPRELQGEFLLSYWVSKMLITNQVYRFKTLLGVTSPCSQQL